MDRLTLKGLQFRAYHGYHQWEREEGNDFEVDLIFLANLQLAGERDSLGDTIDYQKAESIVRSVMEGKSVKLIETLAKRMGDELFRSFPKADRLEVAVRKLSPPLKTETAHSEICMQWQR
jgi:dihydroneopterin aldolase